MAIEDYMPDFAVEAVYDLTVESLKGRASKRFCDFDNTLIGWNNPDGTRSEEVVYDLRCGHSIIVVQ